MNARSILAIPAVYSLFSRIVGADAGRAKLIERYIRPYTGARILDIGCGPADILGSLPVDVQYVGFDASLAYIDAARERWGSRGRFTCALVAEDTIGEDEFDIVLALGVLHHLNDDEAAALFRMARRVLRTGGRLVTLDGVYVKGQSPLARFLISKDRGQFVRRLDEYQRLAATTFPNAKSHVLHDLLAPFPYTHLIMECIP